VRATHFPPLRHWTDSAPAGAVRRFLTGWLSRSHERNAFRHLSALDDHILRDIGVERSLIVLAANTGVERVCPSPIESQAP
jgi:uncharacterized protein YjiS (DUF1127 family)